MKKFTIFSFQFSINDSLRIHCKLQIASAKRELAHLKIKYYLTLPDDGFVRFTKKSLIFSSLLLVILSSIILYSLFIIPKSVSAAWFNDNWLYRKAITVTVTSNSSDITNLETLVTVDTTGITAKLQSSCQDLRFTNASGKLLPYYIDSCSNNSATNKIWVMLDLVPKNTTTYTLYMYYGNPSVGAASNSTLFDNVVGLKGYWTMNDNVQGNNTTLKDSSSGGSNGTNTSTDSTSTNPDCTAAGEYSKGCTLDGTDDYVNVPVAASSALDITSTVTIEAWVKPAQNTVLQYVLSRGVEGGTTGARGYALLQNGSVFNFGRMGGGNFNGVTSIVIGQWYHVVGVTNGASSQLYVNGVLDASGAISIPGGSTTDPVRIGNVFNGTTSGLEAYFNGTIDDVKVYNTARTATQVAADYTNQYAIQTAAVGTSVPSTSFATEEVATAPAAYWKFDEGYGTTANDSTTNSATGTLAGATLPTWQTEDQCVSGKCLFFNGSTSKITVSKVINNVNTVSMWVRPNSVSSSALIDLDGGTHKITVSSGTITASGFTSPTIYVNGVVSSTLSANTWQYVEVTTGTGFATTSSLTIGNSSTTFLQGYIDDVKLYGYARTSSQVTADYNNRGNNEGLAELQGNAKNLPGALSNGLVGYWKMDESSGNLTDSSGNANTGSVTGTSVVGGEFGNGRSFNGTSDFASITDTSTLDPSNFTVSFWVKENSEPTDFAHIISKLDAGTPNKGWGVVFNNVAPRKVYISLKDTSGNETNTAGSPTALTIGAWTHLTYTFNGSTITVYVNGVKTTTSAMSTTFQPSTTPLVFARASSFSGNFSPVTLDEVRYYNRALSPTDVSSVYNFAPGPVGYWKMDESSGNVNDSSGNNNTGTPTGTTVVPGKFGKARKFNGSSDYIDAGTFNALDSASKFTLSFWGKRSAANAILSVGKSAGGTDDTYINVWSDGNVYLDLYNGSAQGCSFANNDTNWHMFTMTYDGPANIVSGYLDGVLACTGNPGFSTTSAVAGDMLIGKDIRLSNFSSGTIDDVRVYNYARNSQQVVEDLNIGHPPPGSPVGTPIGYWKFDEGYGTTAHNSGNGSSIDGTLTNMSSPATSTSGWTQSGKFGKALSFDGTDDFVSVPDASNLRLTGDLTISAWVKPTNFSAFMQVAAKTASGITTANPYRFELIQTTGALRLWRGNGTTEASAYSGSNVVPSGSWSYVAVTQSGTNVTFYINGVAAGTGTISTTATDGGQPLMLGKDGGGHQFNGQMDEIKVYDFALTADQVRLDMNRSSAQVLGSFSDNSSYQKLATNQLYCVPGDSSSCAAPVGEWNFEEGSGTTANDSSGDGNTGTLTGNAGSTPSWTQGKIGKGLDFNANANTNWIGVPDASSLQLTGDMSIEAWVKPDSYSGVALLDMVSKWDGGTNAWRFGVGAGSGNLIFRRYSGGVTDANVSSTGTIFTPGTWYHVGVTQQGTTVTFYINGTSSGSSTVTAGPYTAPTAQVTLGGLAGSNGFTGRMDQVRVYNYARSAAQIAWDYNRGLPVAWYKFDDCQGATTIDSSGNGNKGTITPGALTLGTCTDGTGTTIWNKGASGKFNYSFYGDGTNDFVTGAIPAEGSNFTYAGWYKTTSSGNNSILSSGENNHLFGVFSGKLEATATNGVIIADTASSNDGNWHLGVFTYDGTTIRLYRDGVLVASGASANYGTGATTFAVGAYGNNTSLYRFNGQIDDARVYNYALTATQIKDIMNLGSVSFRPATGAP